MSGISDRQQEIRRRRNRKVKMKVLERKAEKATASEKAIIAAKIRRMTAGAEVIIERMGLEGR